MLSNKEPVDTEDLTRGESKTESSTVYFWAMLMARIYEILPLLCPQCGGEMEIIAFITEVDPIHRRWNRIRILIKLHFRNRDKLNRYQNLSMIKPA